MRAANSWTWSPRTKCDTDRCVIATRGPTKCMSPCARSHPRWCRKTSTNTIISIINEFIVEPNQIWHRRRCVIVMHVMHRRLPIVFSSRRFSSSFGVRATNANRESDMLIRHLIDANRIDCYLFARLFIQVIYLLGVMRCPQRSPTHTTVSISHQNVPHVIQRRYVFLVVTLLLLAVKFQNNPHIAAVRTGQWAAHSCGHLLLSIPFDFFTVAVATAAAVHFISGRYATRYL